LLAVDWIIIVIRIIYVVIDLNIESGLWNFYSWLLLSCTTATNSVHDNHLILLGFFSLSFSTLVRANTCWNFFLFNPLNLRGSLNFLIYFFWVRSLFICCTNARLLTVLISILSYNFTEEFIYAKRVWFQLVLVIR
jgi:hypothetical protein